MGLHGADLDFPPGLADGMDTATRDPTRQDWTEAWQVRRSAFFECWSTVPLGFNGRTPTPRLYRQMKCGLGTGDAVNDQFHFMFPGIIPAGGYFSEGSWPSPRSHWDFKRISISAARGKSSGR